MENNQESYILCSCFEQLSNVINYSDFIASKLYIGGKMDFFNMHCDNGEL